MDSNDLISEYRKADFNHRLHLYMDTPALRHIFLQIDKSESRTLTESTDVRDENLLTEVRRLLNRWFNEKEETREKA